MPIESEAITIEVDAPKGGVPVLRLVKKLRELLHILVELDKEMSADHRNTARWVVVKASYNSPLRITVAPRSFKGRTPNRAIPKTYIEGVKMLEERATEPPFFTPSIMVSTMRLLKTTSSTGGALTLSGPDSAPVRPTNHLTRNIDRILRSKSSKEYTTIEGKLEGIDIHQKLEVRVYDPLTGYATACHFRRSLYETAYKALGHRVAVTGMATFNREDRPVSMVVDEITCFKDPKDLPRFLDGEQIDITGGMDSVAFVRGFRDAE